MHFIATGSLHTLKACPLLTHFTVPVVATVKVAIVMAEFAALSAFLEIRCKLGGRLTTLTLGAPHSLFLLLLGSRWWRLDPLLGGCWNWGRRHRLWKWNMGCCQKWFRLDDDICWWCFCCWRRQRQPARSGSKSKSRSRNTRSRANNLFPPFTKLGQFGGHQLQSRF